MKLIKVMTLMGVMAAFGLAKESQENPFYFRASLLSTQGDWRAFTNNSRGHGFEVGYTAPMGDDSITFGVFGGFLSSTGKARPDMADAKYSLCAWRAGGDIIFKTPLDPLRVYAGLNVQGWDGNDAHQVAPAGGVEDSKPKFGLRVGFEYRINQKFGVGMEYNASEWRSSQEANTYPVKGLNPINPSWLAFYVQYRFTTLN